MKVTLRAGGEIDLLNRGELSEELALFGAMLDKHDRERFRERGVRAVRGPGDYQKTDGTGAAVLYPYRVKQGFTFVLHHVLVACEGASASAPYKTTPVAVEVRRDDNLGELIDFSPEPDQTGQLPTILKRIGYPLKNGEQVAIVVIAGPVNTRVYANVTGELRRGD